MGPAIGRVAAIYNGQCYTGHPRDIPLNPHAQIQLEIGTPLVAPGDDYLPTRPVGDLLPASGTARPGSADNAAAARPPDAHPGVRAQNTIILHGLRGD